jgi:hypothetical protein
MEDRCARGKFCVKTENASLYSKYNTRWVINEDKEVAIDRFPDAPKHGPCEFFECGECCQKYRLSGVTKCDACDREMWDCYRDLKIRDYVFCKLCIPLKTRSEIKTIHDLRNAFSPDANIRKPYQFECTCNTSVAHCLEYHVKFKDGKVGFCSLTPASNSNTVRNILSCALEPTESIIAASSSNSTGLPSSEWYPGESRIGRLSLSQICDDNCFFLITPPHPLTLLKQKEKAEAKRIKKIKQGFKR